MKEIVERIVSEILVLAKNYGDLYKAASDLVEHWEGYAMGSQQSAIRWLEITEEHIGIIAAILKEHQQ